MPVPDPMKVATASRLLQEIEDELGAAGASEQAMDPKIRFPRGFINTAGTYRARFRCRRKGIGDNVAYTLQFHDVLRWILQRTDLGITAQRMVIKYGIVSIVSVIEGLIYDSLTSHRLVVSKKLRSNLKKAKDAGIISLVTFGLLQEVLRKREKIHLHLYEISGTETYDLSDWNSAVAALQMLAEDLTGET